MLDKDCLKFGNMEFEESETESTYVVSLLILPVPMLDKGCLKFGNMEFEESESEWKVFIRQ